MNKKNRPLRVLVTAGPTRAYLDRVRYLSNGSSGRLGYLICEILAKNGIKVIAVVGPSEVSFDSLKNISLFKVETVEEMHRAVMQVCKKYSPDFAVLSAAVLDFTPKTMMTGKVSSKNSWNLALVPTPKIIDEITIRFPRIKKIAFKLEWKRPSPKSIKAFGLKNIKDRSAVALCLNYLSDINKTAHPAFLFNHKGGFQKAKTKQEIAEWICNYILTTE